MYFIFNKQVKVQSADRADKMKFSSASAETSQIERFFYVLYFQLSGFEPAPDESLRDCQDADKLACKFRQHCHARGRGFEPACRNDTQIEFSWS